MSPSLCRNSHRVSIILISLIFTASCGQNTHYAPVTDTTPPPSEKVSHHIVAEGETLYSIAWRFNLDYKKLALANGIATDFAIYPGQRLELQERVTTTSEASKTERKVVKSQPKTPDAAPTRSKKETQSETVSISNKALADPKTWSWPANGKVIAGFQSNKGLNKGIDIEGKLGEPVLAAASGEVVFSGEGLRGYGKLVIVKHSDKFLSAYAHNQTLLVEEGALVKQGEKIALMGATGTDSTKLHFEIRIDGKPVDPLKLLPAR